MPVWRLQCSLAGDSAFDRDRFVMTPHFDDQGPGTDPQGLCDDLAAALKTYLDPIAVREISVTAYDAQGTVPVFPQGQAVVNPAASPPSTNLREVAICLSFFAQANRPRQRGRLYVPLAIVQSGASVPVRPSTTIRQKVADLVPILTGLGGTDVDWVVYSRVDNQPRSVSHWWVDDEWDVVRSRGLRPTTRLEGDVSE